MKTTTFSTKLSMLAICLSTALISAQSFATQSPEMETEENSALSIEFVEPKDFTDIRPSNESRARFREYVLSNIEEYFAELSSTLPEGQTLSVSVTDIDLAGDTRSPRIPIGSQLHDVRVMEDIYFPRIKFSYELQDASGAVIKADEVNLKDMAYLNRGGMVRSNRDAFPYEKNMLEKWFKDTFTAV